MKLNLRLTDYCALSMIQQAGALLENGELRHEQVQTLPDGKKMLSARAVDSFNFVDHPKLTVDVSGTAVSDFRCDCPDYRSTHNFCLHCAALALKFGADAQAHEDAPPVMATCSAAENILMQEAPQIPVEPESSLTVQDFSYAFCNSSRDLYPGIARPRIPLIRYKQVFGDNIRAKRLYQMAGLWGGSCFGMTASSTMLYMPDSGMDLAEFNPAAQCPSQLRLSDRSTVLNMTLHETVEAVHITQYSDAINTPRVLNLYDRQVIDKLCSAVSEFQRTGSNPVCMAVWDKGFTNGHSVFPYHLEKTNGAEDILHIYDPNWPMTVRYAYIQKDANGNYINWRFPMNNHEEYSSKTGGALSFDSYETYKTVWDNRGGPDVNNLMSAEPGTTVMDANGAVVAVVTEKGVETYRDDINRIMVTGAATAQRNAVMLSLPVARYIVRNENPDKELSIHLVHVDQAVTVVTAAREVEILVDDESLTEYVSIAEAGQQYTIEFESTMDVNWANVKLEGVSGLNGVQFAQHKGQLYSGEFAENEDVSLYVNDEPESLLSIRGNIEQIFQNEAEEQLDEQYITSAKPKEKPDDTAE